LFVKTEDVNSAFDIFNEMIAKGVHPDEVTYTSLIDGLVMSNRVTDAESLFCSIISIKDRIQGNQLDLHGFSKGAAYIASSIFIRENLSNHKGLIIITGKGLHFSSALFEMRDFIKKKIGENFPHLTCKIDQFNEGRIVLN
jgi:pentatricopeptide repeat protein